MKFSKPGQYALRSMIYLATSSHGRTVTIEEIARETKLPKHFLSKVFQDLVHSNLVVSQKGPHGGVNLARSPEDILFIVSTLTPCVPQYIWRLFAFNTSKKHSTRFKSTIKLSSIK